MSTPLDKSKSNNPRCKGGFVRADLKAFLDTELSPIRSWFVRRHIEHCYECREEVAWLQRLGKNMRTLEGAYPRPELRARILATLPNMDPSPLSNQQIIQPRRPVYLRYATVGALSVVVGTAAIAAWHSKVQSGAAVVHEVLATKPGNLTRVNRPGVVNNKREQVKGLSVSAVQPDPTSIEANRLTALQLKNEQEEAARQMPKNWKHAVAAVRAFVSPKTPGAYVLAAVDVTDVDSAQSSLELWAKQAHLQTMRITPGEFIHHTAVELISTLPGSSDALFKQLNRVGRIAQITTGGIDSNVTMHYQASVPVPQDNHPGTGSSTSRTSEPPSSVGVYGAGALKPDTNKPATSTAPFKVVVQFASTLARTN